jgi:hypothetical protein
VDRDLSAFLVQLSIALHKSAAYPARHPMVAGAVDVATKSLTELLSRRPALSLGVTRNQLLIEGEGTDPSHPVLRELALRLYRRQLGGLTFMPGVEPEEFSDLLRALNVEAAVTGAEEGGAPQWPHVRLHPLAFDQLQLVGETDRAEPRPEANANQLWTDLVGSALGRSGGSSGDGGTPDAATLAQAIDARVPEPGYARAVTRQLLALAREVRSGEGAKGRAVSQELADLVMSLKPETLRRLLALGPDPAEREQLALEVSRAMPVTAVLELVRATAEASQQTISHSLLRILAKLAAHAESGTIETWADDALRDMVRDLLADWALKDPNPAGYSEMLEGFARPGGIGGAAPRAAARRAEAGEPLRLVQMALELGVTGEPVIAAVDTLVEQHQTPAVLDLLGQAPPGDPTAEAVWSRLPTRDELRRILERDDPDPALVDRLLRRLGIEGAEPLLDALAESDSRTNRRRLLTWLVQLGPGIGPLIMARLDSPHWYVLRNMLVLLGGIEPWPPEFSPPVYLVHADARVRREALKLALRVPELRDQGICTGLADGDDLILRTALAAALDGCPAEAVPLLIDQLEMRGQAADVRVQLVRVLGTLRTPAARDCLVRRALARRRWLPGRRLAPKSPELVAAISGLAARWASDPAVADVLRLAARSADPEIRAASGASM